MMKSVAVLGTILALAAADASAQDIDKLTVDARAQSAKLVQELGARLKQELARGGTEAAIDVCKEAAPEVANRLSRESGSRVTRVSLKTRNPMLGSPDAWEQAALAGFDQAAASGAKAETLEAAEIVTEPQGRYFRYVKAIPVQPLCLACHGPESELAQSVRERLRAQYPHDRAVGYQPGQVRGAVSIKTFIGD